MNVDNLLALILGYLFGLILAYIIGKFFFVIFKYKRM